MHFSCPFSFVHVPPFLHGLVWHDSLGGATVVEGTTADCVVVAEETSADINGVENGDTVANLHTVPFPVNPSLHMHEYEPKVFAHVALICHP